MKIPLSQQIKQYVQWSILSALCGLLSGLAATLFLVLLDIATRFRLAHPYVIGALPIGGFLVGWLYFHFGKDVAGGNNLIIDEIHDPQKTIPFRMAPFVLLGTLVTHLFGGSAGREGTAVQMGASLSDQLSRFFHIAPEKRKVLLVAGAGAGFGAAVGAPWAGMIFGMEVINIGKLKLFAWAECFIASFVGYYTTHLLGAPHTIYPTVEIPDLDGKAALWVCVAGIAFGLSTRVFVALTHAVERTQAALLRYPPLKPALGGLLLVALFSLEGSLRYTGLGIASIQEAFVNPASFKDPMLKTFFTSLTIGSGFKGGEFIPLVFIGATLGSALSILLPLSFQLLASLGFAAVFAGAANTPLACSLMAMELFGYRIAPYALIACFMSYYVSSHKGIYQSQKIHASKHSRLGRALGLLGQLPKRFWKGERKS